MTPEEMEFMFHAVHAPMKLVYARLAIRPANESCQAGVEAMSNIESKLRQDITPAPDADALFVLVRSHRS